MLEKVVNTLRTATHVGVLLSTLAPYGSALAQNSAYSPYAIGVHDYDNTEEGAKYNDPQQAVGPPQPLDWSYGRDRGPFHHFNLSASLGLGGFISLKMAECAETVEGVDLFIYEGANDESFYVWVKYRDQEKPIKVRDAPYKGVGYGPIPVDLNESNGEIGHGRQIEYVKIEDAAIEVTAKGWLGADIDAIVSTSCEQSPMS